MRKSNQQNIGEAIEQFFSENHLTEKFLRVKIVAKWEEFVGKMVANKTNKVYFLEEKLVVEMNSAEVRNELAMVKSLIIQRINKEAGKDLVKEIIIR